MAVILPGLYDALVRTTGLLEPSSDFTLAFWGMYTQASAADYLQFLILADGTESSYVWVGNSGVGVTDVELTVGDGTSYPSVAGPAVSLQVWQHYAVTYSHSTHVSSFYVNATLLGTVTLDLGSGSPYVKLSLGDDGGGNQPGVAVAYYREWTAVLSATEIAAEMAAMAPVRTTNLSFHDALTDQDHLGLWTHPHFVGTVAGPLINPLASSATAVTLPWTLTEDPHVIDPTNGQWFSFVPDPAVYYVGFRMTGTAGDQTYLLVLLADGYTNIVTANYVGVGGAPIQVPVTPGQTYYVQVFAGGTLGVSITVTATPAPNLDAPVGTLLVPDDTYGLPGLLLSAVDGTILRAVPISAGEGGDVMPDGTMLLEDHGEQGPSYPSAALYDVHFNLLRRLFAPFGTAQAGNLVIVSDQVNKWYVTPSLGAGTYTWHLQQLAANGDLLQSWSLSLTSEAFAGMAVPPGSAGNFLYWVHGTVGVSPPVYTIRTFDLTTGTFGADFAAPAAGTTINEIIVLPGGTVLVALEDWNSGATSLRAYSPAGAVLRDFSPPAGFRHDHIARNVASTTDFWWWTQTASGSDNQQSRFQRIRLSDGVVLTDFTVPIFEGGLSNTTDTPASFGPSASCPFLALPVESPAPGSAPPAGSIVVSKATTPAVTNNFPFAAGGGLTPATFLLANGDSRTFPAVPVGSGYSIVETVPIGWTAAYAVSNSSPNTDLTVADGETVTVTVTNTSTGGGGGSSGTGTVCASVSFGALGDLAPLGSRQPS